MTPETEKIIKEQIKQLPKEWQQIIATGIWRQRLRLIFEKNKITTDETQAFLLSEVLLLMLGLQDFNRFENQIKKNHSFPKNQVEFILADIKKGVFSLVEPIIGNLIKDQDKGKAGDVSVENQGTEFKKNTPSDQKFPVDTTRNIMPLEKNMVVSQEKEDDIQKISKETGVEITREQPESMPENVVPQKTSLMAGIEHPEQITKKTELLNPVSSKLAGTTRGIDQKRVPDNPSERGYSEGQDPYREPMN